MNSLKKLLETTFTVRSINFDNDKWHHGLPNKSGWYFVETDAPLNVLTALPSPPSEYTNDAGVIKKCRNYDIKARAKALESALGQDSKIIYNEGLRPVYSGMANNILNRAREHTFGHHGTAGLALAKYNTLFGYQWKFHYIENTLPSHSPAHKEITLKLGEQIWRANYGWPLLCSG
ncbi:hypothetical protein [Pseudomonas veronii]|uniref:Uncharacterized protein n=1 Tax=Pseudomonas veronii TaxID=76761 RepID=A0A4P7YB90_PSEVE|nr:hypothetical protein [Pseudomonas veronii]QCG68119.1 hypothetical protein E4167_29495 [Pseudomonas veronii]